MPFKLTNIPTLFQKIINHILRKHLNIIIITYLDNILIFSQILKKYKKHIKLVL